MRVISFTHKPDMLNRQKEISDGSENADGTKHTKKTMFPTFPNSNCWLGVTRPLVCIGGSDPTAD